MFLLRMPFFCNKNHEHDYQDKQYRRACQFAPVSSLQKAHGRVQQIQGIEENKCQAYEDYNHKNRFPCALQKYSFLLLLKKRAYQ